MCLKLTIKILELVYLLLTYLAPFYNAFVSIVDFEQVNVCQVIVNFKHSQHIDLTIHF